MYCPIILKEFIFLKEFVKVRKKAQNYRNGRNLFSSPKYVEVISHNDPRIKLSDMIRNEEKPVTTTVKINQARYIKCNDKGSIKKHEKGVQ